MDTRDTGFDIQQAYVDFLDKCFDIWKSFVRKVVVLYTHFKALKSSDRLIGVRFDIRKTCVWCETFCTTSEITVWMWDFLESYLRTLDVRDSRFDFRIGYMRLVDFRTSFVTIVDVLYTRIYYSRTVDVRDTHFEIRK